MEKICGKVEWLLTNVGSKSEGRKAYLICEDGIRYHLYRPGCLNPEDDFFAAFGGQEVEVCGNIEQRMRNISVVSIGLKSAAAHEEQKQTPEGECIRLPRKLKKVLKKMNGLKR